MTLLCERCHGRIDRATEPLRLRSHRVPCAVGGPDLDLRSAVHARPCVEPDTGDWDPVRRGVSPAALRWAAEQADHR